VRRSSAAERRAITDRALAASLSRWFARSARPLPWRTVPRDAYRSLVSEVMLQQTQVSRVLERFERFIARFPTPAALAEAQEQEVLAQWAGLGYYRRARHLHAAARMIVERHGGCVPENLNGLRELPGVGRYTAGAIASIVFGRHVPIVDGNVTRVLLRVHGRSLPHGSPQALAWAWRQAGSLVASCGRPALFNEGLMELGATICTPRNPACARCPLRGHCLARARGQQHRIPRPKRSPARSSLHCASVLVTDRAGRLLVEPRDTRGLWGGLWQTPTLESTQQPRAPAIRAWLGLRTIELHATFAQATTHRDVVFHVWHAPPLTPAGAALASAARPHARWLTKRQIDALPLSTPQRRILLAKDP
jgi:A/G-specific adenine glycosylase